MWGTGLRVLGVGELVWECWVWGHWFGSAGCGGTVLGVWEHWFGSAGCGGHWFESAGCGALV